MEQHRVRPLPIACRLAISEHTKDVAVKMDRGAMRCRSPDRARRSADARVPAPARACDRPPRRACRSRSTPMRPDCSPRPSAPSVCPIMPPSKRIEWRCALARSGSASGLGAAAATVPLPCRGHDDCRNASRAAGTPVADRSRRRPWPGRTRVAECIEQNVRAHSGAEHDASALRRMRLDRMSVKRDDDRRMTAKIQAEDVHSRH